MSHRYGISEEKRQLVSRDGKAAGKKVAVERHDSPHGELSGCNQVSCFDHVCLLLTCFFIL